MGGTSHQTAFNTRVILFATLGSLTYGYCSSIISTTLGQPSFLQYMHLENSKRATVLIGAINGIYQAGGLLGTISTSWTSDALGRRKAIFLGALVSIIGGVLQTASVNAAMFIVARLITGLGIGCLVTLIPLWQGEVASPATRGFSVGLHGVFILTGYSLASWIGAGFFFVNANGAQWRIPLAFQTIPPLLLAAGVMRLPESPRWLIENGRHAEAKDIVLRLHGADNEADTEGNGIHTFAEREYEEMVVQIMADSVLPSSWVSMIQVPSYRKRALIGFFTMFAAQCTGTLVINNYGSTLYKSLGFDTKRLLLIQAGWITLGIPANVLNAILLDRVGRKWLMIAGLCGTSSAVLGEAVTVALFEGTNNKAGIAAAVFFLFWHISWYGSTLDASTYVYASEIWPTHIRAKGTALSTSGLFVGSLILLSAASDAFASIGWKYYMVFFSVTVVSIFIFAIWWPETKGLSLEKIGALFGDEVVQVLDSPHDPTAVNIDVATSGKDTEKD